MSPEEARGFVSALFDFSFTNLIATRVIKVLYVIFLIVLALGALGGVGAAVISIVSGNIIGGLVTLVALPFVLLIYLILGRLYHELIILAFRGLEHLEAIRRNTEKAE